MQTVSVFDSSHCVGISKCEIESSYILTIIYVVPQVSVSCRTLFKLDTLHKHMTRQRNYR